MPSARRRASSAATTCSTWGDWHARKGVFRLLEAAARSADPWPLRLIGSGPAEDALRRRARALGIAQRVSFRPFVGDRERLARAYAGARCVVMPGEHETFGLVGPRGGGQRCAGGELCERPQRGAARRHGAALRSR